MTNISDNLKKGNFGEHLVSYALSRHCLVRPVAEGTDIGIDLYCETFDEQGRPYLHFWVQVKTSESFDIDKDTNSFSFKVEHIKYWNRQPLPVYIFLVPYMPKRLEVFPLFIIDLTRVLEKIDINAYDSKQKIQLQSQTKINGFSELKSLIEENLPETTAIHKLREGIVAPIPVIGSHYMQTVPHGFFVLKNLLKIENQLKTTISATLEDIILYFEHIQGLIDKGDYTEEEAKKHFEELSIERYKTRLANLLTAISDKGNWEIHFTLGRYHLHEGNKDEARRFFLQSIDKIKRDKKFDKEAGSKYITTIESYLKNIED